MDNTRNSKKIKLYLIAVLLFGMAILLLKFDPLYLGALSDKDMIAIFHQHQAAFVKLQKMIAEDRVSSVTEQYIDPNLTRTRWKKYKSLMDEISHKLTITYDPGSTRFVLNTGGFLSIGPEWVKGIEYANNPKRDGIIKQSLNNPGELAYGQVYLRKLQRDWFIFFQKSH